MRPATADTARGAVTEQKGSTGDAHDSKAGDAMTARVGGDRRTTRLIAVEGDRSWALRALCRNDFRFSDGPFDTRVDPTRRLARQLAHRCRAHCPVIKQCTAELTAQAPVRPRKAVRAGVFFPDGGRPKLLADSGCGPHCYGLPDVHRKAAPAPARVCRCGNPSNHKAVVR